MRPHRQILRHHYQRQQRLTTHLGITAVKGRVTRRLGKFFWATSVSLVVAIVLLVGIWLAFAGSRDNSSAKQPFEPASQPAPLHTANPESITTTPTTVTPESLPIQQTPKPTQPQPTKTAFSTTITIDGDADCKSDTLAALELISQKAPTHYATVTKYVGVIKCVTQGSGMEAYLNPPRYLVGDSTRNGGTLWYAGTIVHDAGHSKLYHDYLSAHPGQSVPYDAWGGQNSEAICVNSQHDALKQMGAPQSTLDYVLSSLSSEYWNVPYDQRWW